MCLGSLSSAMSTHPLLSPCFTRYMLNWSSTPSIGPPVVCRDDAEYPWGLTFLEGSELSSLVMF